MVWYCLLPQIERKWLDQNHPIGLKPKVRLELRISCFQKSKGYRNECNTHWNMTNNKRRINKDCNQTMPANLRTTHWPRHWKRLIYIPMLLVFKCKVLKNKCNWIEKFRYTYWIWLQYIYPQSVKSYPEKSFKCPSLYSPWEDYIFLFLLHMNCSVCFYDAAGW